MEAEREIQRPALHTLVHLALRSVLSNPNNDLVIESNYRTPPGYFPLHFCGFVEMHRTGPEILNPPKSKPYAC